jgi:hypothetical protein
MCWVNAGQCTNVPVSNFDQLFAWVRFSFSQNYWSTQCVRERAMAIHTQAISERVAVDFEQLFQRNGDAAPNPGKG